MSFPKSLSRRLRGVAFSALAFASLSPLTTAVAQTWPSRPIHFVVPFAAGGTTDVLARAVAAEAARELGQQIVVENKPGAGGNIGIAHVANATADGYTLAVIGNNFAVNPSLYTRLGWKPDALTGVALLGEVPFALFTPAGSPYRDLKSVLDDARARPEALRYASGGSGTVSHLGAHWLAATADVKLTHVPYRGVSQAIVDVLGGQVELMLDTLVNSTPHMEAGKLRPLLVTTAARLPSLPDVPTIGEAGFPGLVFNAWIGLIAPAGTPTDVIARLNDAVNKALAQPNLQATLGKVGAQGRPLSVEATRTFMKEETARWGEVVRTSGAKAD